MSNYHHAYILLGSNISPVDNLKNAINHLRSKCAILAMSKAWENTAIGSTGPNYLNLAILINTWLSASDLKSIILSPIETILGRARTNDKNSPRPIDLDIIIYENEVLDKNLWSRLYIALPMSEIIPDLINPENGKSLLEIARLLHQRYWAIINQEI